MVLYGTTMQLRDTPYFASLDGLRAFSILFVIFHHAMSRMPWRTHFHGWLGVDIFFVLSGFLITFLLERESQDAQKVDLPAFYIRRAFRILPVYFVMLIVYIVATYLSGDATTWHLMKRDLPYFLTFLNEFAPSPNGFIAFGFSWTLAVEEKFYLIWPILCFTLLATAASKVRRPVVLAMLYTSILAVAPVKFQAARSYSGLLVGSLLALALTDPRTIGLRHQIQKVPVILPLGFFVFGICLIDINRNFLFLFSWTVVFLVAHLVTTPSWLRNFLSLPSLTWLGKRSYGMYLIHMLPLQLIQKLIHSTFPFEPFVVTCCTLVLTALIADVVFRFIESPARNFGKRLLGMRRASHEKSLSKPSVLAEAAVMN
jgi:peptidoglycan/LPS O-acetylase OafA/YrhL